MGEKETATALPVAGAELASREASAPSISERGGAAQRTEGAPLKGVDVKLG